MLLRSSAEFMLSFAPVRPVISSAPDIEFIIHKSLAPRMWFLIQYRKPGNISFIRGLYTNKSALGRHTRNKSRLLILFHFFVVALCAVSSFFPFYLMDAAAL